MARGVLASPNETFGGDPAEPVAPLANSANEVAGAACVAINCQIINASGSRSRIGSGNKLTLAACGSISVEC